MKSLMYQILSEQLENLASALKNNTDEETRRLFSKARASLEFVRLGNDMHGLVKARRAQEGLSSNDYNEVDKTQIAFNDFTGFYEQIIAKHKDMYASQAA